jgi:hypothetical protein
MLFSGWRALVWLLAALLVVGLLLTVIFWVGVLLAVLAVVGWFNLLLLPRVAQRLRTNELVLASVLLPLLGAGGFTVAGLNGLIAGSIVWVLGVALPRGLMWRMRRRLARGGTQLRRMRVIDSGFTVKNPG